MIELKNVSESYVNGVKVIDNMNLKVEDGIVDVKYVIKH